LGVRSPRLDVSISKSEGKLLLDFDLISRIFPVLLFWEHEAPSDKSKGVMSVLKVELESLLLEGY
jgi:hypothetical protein